MSVTNRDALRILRALVDGIDPATGEDLRGQTVFQRADVIRALLAAASALQEREERVKRRASLPINIGRRWTDEEDGKLTDAFKRHVPLGSIAAEHGRSVRAIEARLVLKGLMAQEERETRDRFEAD